MKEDEPMKLPLKQHMEESVYTIEDDVRKLLKKETAELYLAEAEKRLDYEVKALNQIQKEPIICFPPYWFC